VSNPESTQPKRSLGFKLLIGATSIVVAILVAALGITFPLLTDDTKNYTFELQASQAQLIGQEFSSTAESAVGTFRIALSSLPAAKEWKPGKILDASKRAQMDSIVSNQEALQDFEVVYYSSPDAPAQSIYRWPEKTESNPPNHDQLDELAKIGATYSSRVSGSTVLMNFFYTEKPAAMSPPPPLMVVHGTLNSSGLVRKSQGTFSQVVASDGLVLFDSRNPEQVGTHLNKTDPLFAAARASVVGVGTLEFVEPKHSDTELGAYVLPGFNVMVLNAIRKVDAFRGTYLLLERLILTGLMLLGAALFIVVFFSTGLSRPLADLTDATNQIAGGNFGLKLDERGTDEIGILSRSMNIMSKKIQELLLESIEKVRIEQEVAIASTLAQNLIPPSEVSTDRFAIHSYYQSAAECGGDWWGYVESRDYVSVIIADATGHGLPAAMLTAAARGCFSAMQKLLQDFTKLPAHPGFLLSYANRAILESTNSELNMTMFIATYSFKDHMLTYTSAGHNPAWMMTKGANGLEFKLLKSRGARLGETRDFVDPKIQSIKLEPGQSVFLYTDGLIEDKNKEDVEYGKDRVREILNTGAAAPTDMANALRKDIEQYYEGVTLADDITFVILEPKT